MTTDQLDILIRRYFDGDTTLDEEQQLRLLLADHAYDSPQADEARAVMGMIGAMARKHKRRPMEKSRISPKMRWPALARAAAVAALVAVGAVTLLQSSPDCVAYAYGKRVDSPELAMHFMMSDFDALGDAQSQVQNQIEADFSAIANALNDENN